MWISVIEVTPAQGSKSMLIANIYWVLHKCQTVFIFFIGFNLHHRRRRYSHLHIRDEETEAAAEALLTVPQRAIFGPGLELRQSDTRACTPACGGGEAVVWGQKEASGRLQGPRVLFLSLWNWGGRCSLAWRGGAGPQGAQGKSFLKGSQTLGSSPRASAKTGAKVV